MLRALQVCAATISIALLAGCGGGAGVAPPHSLPSAPANNKVRRISTDPFTNPSSQHATQVEPSAYAVGGTIVAAFQSGRFFTAGSSDIGFATSHDGGTTWAHGFLGGTTPYASPGGPFDSVSDPVVAYDAAHAVWLIGSLPIVFSSAATPAALVSRSSDGLNWSLPVAVAPGQAANDKDWLACDNNVSSPFFGHCYMQWDDPIAGTIHVSTSTDGGTTWGPVHNTLGNATGIDGQTVIQPNGTVIIPIDDFNEQNVIAFTSHDGGATWSAPVPASSIIDHFENGNLRSGPLISGAIDGSGIVYVVWQDCRFRAQCSSNDLVISTSVDGVHWSAPARIPIDPTTSGVDHFIPGIGIEAGTSGAGAHIGITYYYYSNSNCNADCQLFVGFIASQDGAATWSAPVTLAGPMSTAWLAQTNQGSMVGDYVATVFSSGHIYGVAAVANPAGATLDEAMYVPIPGELTARSAVHLSSRGERPIPGARANHPPRIRPPIR